MTLLMLCHHQIKFEKATEPVENRIAYIKAWKPANQTETRLKWLREIHESELGEGFWERWDEYKKQLDALWDEYNRECNALYAEYMKQCDALRAEYDKQLDALWAEYKKQCDALRAEYIKQCNVLLWKLCPELKTIWDKAMAEGLPWDEEKHSLIFPEEKNEESKKG